MMRGLILAGAILLAGPSHAQTLTPIRSLPDDARPLNLHAVGRMQVRRDGNHVAYVHQWPGIYFEAALKGDQAYLGFDDPTNTYRLLVDERPALTIVKPGEIWLKLGDIGPGEHRLRLEKVTESIDQTGTFDGLYTAAGGSVEPAPPPRKRAIEFIGASGEAGYGVHSTTRTCTKQEVHDLTDTQLAWTVLTAKHFDADYEINAISGRGLVRNYDGAVPGQEMPKLYPYTFYDKTVPVSDRHWQPNVVVITTGAADFATPLKPGEAWKTQYDLARDVMFAAGRFIVAVHQRYPRATILLAWQADSDDPEGRQLIKAGRQSIETAAAQAGLKHLIFTNPFAGANPERTGCDYHGSLKDQENGAKTMIDWLNAHPDVW